MRIYSGEMFDKIISGVFHRYSEMDRKCVERVEEEDMTVNLSYDQCDDTVASVYAAPALSAELN